MCFSGVLVACWWRVGGVLKVFWWCAESILASVQFSITDSQALHVSLQEAVVTWRQGEKLRSHDVRVTVMNITSDISSC